MLLLIAIMTFAATFIATWRVLRFIERRMIARAHVQYRLNRIMEL